MMRTFLANFFWFLSSLPGLIRFLIACRHVRRTQAGVLISILRKNGGTVMGRRLGFDSINDPEQYKMLPLSEYEDYAGEMAQLRQGETNVLTLEPVELLQPTSGSVTATKLIPYTVSLGTQFRNGIDPWIASLYIAQPSIMLGKHYWAISPNTRAECAVDSAIPVGFASDAEYLGKAQRLFTEGLFAVPSWISKVQDMSSFEYLTLFFLLKERNLRLVSVWHASFLALLIEKMPRLFSLLLSDIRSGAVNADLKLDASIRKVLSGSIKPDPERARELAKVDIDRPDFPSCIWPHLELISCWADGHPEPWLSQIRGWFPHAVLKGKGLTATEGIVSIPVGVGGRKVLALRSHYFEFIDAETGAVADASNVQEGKKYSIVVTTGGGLYRYKLHDLVRVNGFFHQAPCLDFISRDNLTCDIAGEKLNLQHVEAVIGRLEGQLDLRFSFAMLAPACSTDEPGYVFYFEAPQVHENSIQFIGPGLEMLLRENYHYGHARNLSQLKALRGFRIEKNAAVDYRAFLIRGGMKAGDVKFHALSREAAWSTVFEGGFLE